MLAVSLFKQQMQLITLLLLLLPSSLATSKSTCTEIQQQTSFSEPPEPDSATTVYYTSVHSQTKTVEITATAVATQTKPSSSTSTCLLHGSTDHRAAESNAAHILFPYPFRLPKQCTYSFARFIRINIFLFFRQQCKQSINIDDIKIANCKFKRHEGENSVAATVLLRHQLAVSTATNILEVALERVEPAARIKAFAPVLETAEYAHVPMNNKALKQTRKAAEMLRTAIGISMLFLLLCIGMSVYVAWIGLHQNTSLDLASFSA